MSRFSKIPDTIKLPDESFGRCKRYELKRRDRTQKCTNYRQVMLADGLCMRCWDRMVSKLTYRETISKSEGGQYLEKVLSIVRDN
jgi:hypothetical protein